MGPEEPHFNIYIDISHTPLSMTCIDHCHSGQEQSGLLDDQCGVEPPGRWLGGADGCGTRRLSACR